MSARILDGRQMARQIVDEIRITVECLVSRGHSPPVVAVVRVGEDPASVRYASQIERLVASAGMGFRPAVLPVSADDDLLGQTLGGLSSDRAITGILLQFPLPAHLSREKAVAAIAPGKDIDGVTPLNAGHFFTGRGRYFVPATPLGGLELLQRSAIPIDGRHAVIVGRSEIVGRPMALLLLRENATVTICHSRTPDLARYTRQADILAVAVGHPGLITGEMIAPGAVVLDFGVNVVNGKVVGDVDFASAVDVAGAITPVPGGTGPMTNAMLLSNILRAARWLGSHKQAEGRAD
jgi:methylenetetrahydrofolate dehydrogenase (NADP+)/methenyltetrahydrofolate cyclohydrolase